MNASTGDGNFRKWRRCCFLLPLQTKEIHKNMKRSISMLAAIAALAQLLTAQASDQTPPTYLAVSTYHVPDATRAPYEAWLKDKMRRFVEAVMKEDPSVLGFTVSRVIYGGVKEPEANYYVSYATQGIPKNRSEVQNKVAKQLFGKSYAELLKEADPLRQRLGQTLNRRWVGTPPTAVEGDILRIDYKKVTPGRMGDYLQLERDYARLREAQVKAGKMKAWSMSSLVLPAGTEREYDAYTSHTAKDLAQSLGWNQGSQEIAGQLSPPFNQAGLVMRTNDISKTVRGETRVVVMVVRRP